MTTAKVELRGSRRLVLWTLFALAAAWLLSPMLFAQHVEGYTSNLKVIALMINRGDPLGGDLLYPAMTEFNFYGRAGVIELLRLADRLFGNTGDWDFRVLTILSFAILAGSSLFIARRLGGVRVWSAALSLLLVPGVSEVAFHFSDNLVSAAFGVAALAVALQGRPVAYFFAGGLAAASMICRLDAILLTPAIAGIAWLRHTAWRPLAIRTLLAAAGFIITLAAAALLLKVTPIDAYLIALHFFPGPGHYTTLIILSLFFGAPGTLLLPIGLFSGIRQFVRSPDYIRRIIVLLLHPALIVFSALMLSTEPRYIYPLLTPYIALYGGKGVEALIEGLRGQYRHLSLSALTLLVLFVALPPPIVAVRDGPRSVVGRLWMPFFWWRWENAMAESLRRVDALVAVADVTPKLLVLSTHFNDDQFLKQRFLAQGYQVRPSEAAFEGCSGFSVYAKGRHVVAHIRTERHHWKISTSKTRLRALLIDRSLSCQALWQFDRAYLALWGDDKRIVSFADTIDPRLLGWFLPRLQPTQALSASFTPASLFRWPPWKIQAADGSVPRFELQGMFHAYSLTPRDLETIAGAAAAYLRLPIQPSPENEDRIVTYEDFRAAYAPRCKNPKDSDWSDVPLCIR